MSKLNETKSQSLIPQIATDTWILVKIIFGIILWLGLMVLTYYTLLTIPAILMITIWLILIIIRYFKQQKQQPLGYQNQDNDNDSAKK